MAFTCINCGQPQAPRTRPRLVVSAVRTVRHQVTEKTKKAKALSSPFVVSTEIVEELQFCEQCPTSFTPIVVGSATIYLSGRKEYH